MAEIIIGPQRLYITDELISYLLNTLKIKYIRFFYEYDIDKKIILIAKQPLAEQLGLSRSWIQIHHGKNYYIRTPEILKPYIGKKIQCRYEKVFASNNEIFRIRPIDFEFHTRLIEQSITSNMVPYFTHSEDLRIPKYFFTKHFDKEALNNRICFDKTTYEILEKGNIIVQILIPPHVGNMSFFLKKYHYELVTPKLYALRKMIYDCGKKMHNFKFMSIIKMNEDKYESIVFKEDHSA